MMYDYVIIHGSYGHPFENWEPWLFNVLTSEGKQVLALLNGWIGYSS